MLAMHCAMMSQCIGLSTNHVQQKVGWARRKRIWPKKSVTHSQRLCVTEQAKMTKTRQIQVHL